MASTTAGLQWNAGYGNVPFDLFLLDYWESAASAPQDDHQKVRDELIRRYLNLPLLNRWLYKRVQDSLSEVEGATPLPTPSKEQIDRMFCPYQSIQERHISAKFCCGWNIVWLRTCYDPSLNQKYLELEQIVGARVEGGCLESSGQILDDPSIYALSGTDQEVLDQLLFRLTGLTDAKGILDEYGDGSLLLYGSGKNDPDIGGSGWEVEHEELNNIALDVQNFIYAVDEEAVEKGIVKIWWFNEFGKIIWDNIAVVPDSDLDRILGAIMDGQGFIDIVGEGSKRGAVIGV